MKYAVTGGTGFIGRRVVHLLRERGHEVVCLARDRGRAEEALGEDGPRLVVGDLADRSALERLMDGADGLFHLAGVCRFGLVGRRARQAMQTNVDGTRLVLEVMRDAETPRGVYTSSLLIHSDTGSRRVTEDHRHDGRRFSSLYEESKWRAQYEVVEPLVEQGLPLVTVLPGAAYGPGDHSYNAALIRFALQRIPMAVPAAGASLSFVHVDDVAEGHVLAMERGEPGEWYHLGGENHTLAAFTEAVSRASGIPLPMAVPGWMAMLNAFTVGLLERLVPLPPVYSSEALRMAAGGYFGIDSSRAHEALGWHARSLEEGMVDTVASELAVVQLPAPR